jgi:hypothetical protein
MKVGSIPRGYMHNTNNFIYVRKIEFLHFMFRELTVSCVVQCSKEPTCEKELEKHEKKKQTHMDRENDEKCYIIGYRAARFLKKRKLHLCYAELHCLVNS